MPNYIRVEDGDWSLTIGFRDVITPSMSAADLQESLDFVAQNRMPAPGLSVDGWAIRPQTPSSHMSGGIAVIDAGPGFMTLRLKPEFFALYGHAKGVVPWADASSPEFSFFQIRQPFTGDIEHYQLELNLAGRRLLVQQRDGAPDQPGFLFVQLVVGLGDFFHVADQRDLALIGQRPENLGSLRRSRLVAKILEKQSP